MSDRKSTFQPLRLLGRHVLRRAHDVAGGGHRLPAPALRDAEVHEARHPVLVAHDVRRLEVAVDDPRLVDGLQALRHLDGHVVALGGRQGALVAQDVLEVDPLDELHRDVEEPAVLAVVVDGADVLVADLAGETDLALEALRHLRVLREVGPQDLDRDHLVEAAVARLVHHPHPAAADRLQDLVAAVEQDARSQIDGDHEIGGGRGQGGPAARAHRHVAVVLGLAGGAGHLGSPGIRGRDRSRSSRRSAAPRLA